VATYIVDDETARSIYEWRQNHAITRATGCFALAGLIVTPMLGAIFDRVVVGADSVVLGAKSYQVWAFGACALLSFICGLVWHQRAVEWRAECITVLGIPEDEW
jgi:hypothetical protein